MFSSRAKGLIGVVLRGGPNDLGLRSHALRVCSQLAPVLPLTGCMSMWVVAHTVVVAVYCFSLCVAVFFTVLQMFTVRRLSHYSSESFVHSVTPIR
jgi:hypothetical protein